MTKTDEVDLSGFAQRLKAERKRLGLSQEVFAEMLGINRASQGNYERGSKVPTVEYLLFAASRGVDLVYLLYGVHNLEMAIRTVPASMYIEVYEIVDKLVSDSDIQISLRGRASLFALILMSFSGGRQPSFDVAEILKAFRDESQ